MACSCNVLKLYLVTFGALVSLLAFLCTGGFFDNCAVIILMACRDDDRCIALAACTVYDTLKLPEKSVKNP